MREVFTHPFLMKGETKFSDGGGGTFQLWWRSRTEGSGTKSGVGNTNSINLDGRLPNTPKEGLRGHKHPSGRERDSRKSTRWWKLRGTNILQPGGKDGCTEVLQQGGGS